MLDQPLALVLLVKQNYKKMNKILSKHTFKNIAIISLIAIFFIGDRLLKIWALKLEPNENYKILGDWLIFSFTKNYNIAFSLPINGTWLLPAIFIIILGLIALLIKIIYQEKKFGLSAIFLTFIIFGAISNMIDRLFYSYVIDYLAIKNVSILNLADVMISLGAILFLKNNFTKTTKEDEAKPKEEEI